MTTNEIDPVDTPDGDVPLSLSEYTQILEEIDNQPKAWRRQADKEMDYADGNQLKTELLQAQQALGIPPSMENLIGAALEGIRGYEEATRTDWRVTPNGQPGGQDVADAINFKLNEAERNARADDACSRAFYPQIGVGVGWVEVSKSDDPFGYPFQCLPINRNEIHWDMSDPSDDQLLRARWLRRQRWMHPSRLVRVFPEHKELIRRFGKSGTAWWNEYDGYDEGGQSTGLSRAADVAREWTIAEDRWYNPFNKEICASELWYRRWSDVIVLKSPDGRVVEFDRANPAHEHAIANNLVQFRRATVAKVRRSYWLGPHVLFDGPTPYAHRFFPYVPFWGFREDQTNVPFGYIRNMLYQQDTLNSGNSRLRWGMSAFRTVRTKGAVAMTDDQFRRTIGRLDADVVLDPAAMAQPGARFEVERDYQMNAQQLDMLNNARQAIERVNPAAAGAFSGRRGTATSGVQEATQVEQANQSLAHMMGNFKRGRTQVGELLLSMLVQDMGTEEQTIVIEGDAVRAKRVITINKPETDPETGLPYLSNDLQRTRLKVSLEDVPSTASFRGQQLQAMSETIKSLPAQYQAAAMPFMASLMDVPFKRELVESLRAAGAQETPEQVEQRIKQAVADALKQAGNDLKARELDMKERLTEAQIKQIMAQAVQTGVQAAFSAMQGGAQVAQMPMIAPIADKIMQGAGYQAPNPGGDDPNFPVPAQTAAMNIKSPYIQGQGPAAMEDATGVRENTSPAFPPVPQQASRGERGIETPTTADNIG
ncbi:hypothetical protein QRO11_15390 [Paracidovorax citrulli]|uniref:Portal protein n=2 Tax=Paracidovorax citrulli TaxID=80869 RepID=A1TMU9_PARC0|nr:hypothetical protein [Paracidovorax citrulli]ABM32287.1 conserved hypothetical protein, putative phage associated protein [Paracidovorax citrulli AAC00-1]ATG94700.1 hypothetical protein CQB05_12225 [Paracidovorax citrulli]PVY66487.1 hypothetical protein C8E08_3895 [Paracidovorax citrulli]QCX12162.1 portal protein [Paracidovorax citrulli]REG69343.1 hypothetical protein C8E07_2491 [Paracidovorax citrulli]